MTETWQRRRSKFNHDWLKNRYLPALGKFMNLLDGKIDDAEFASSFISEVLPQWEANRDEALLLSQDFELEMSPRVLFDRSPLCQCDRETKQWLSELLHELWIVRHPVKKWVEEASSCIRDVDTAYASLKQRILESEHDPSSNSLALIRDDFAEFRRLCQELAQAMEKFFHEVVVA